MKMRAMIEAYPIVAILMLPPSPGSTATRH
jgi:hypothetical protein